jgi:two-component system, OmpR family, sensor histidine kinase CreC
VLGETFHLQQPFHNRLENAIAFRPTGSRLEVRAVRAPNFQGEGRAGPPKGESIRIEVLDEGPGIPAFAREKVFEKFFSLQRPDTGRKSSGLGLTIVQEITRLHRGSIRLEARPEGGLRAIWILPAAAD